MKRLNRRGRRFVLQRGRIGLRRAVWRGFVSRRFVVVRRGLGFDLGARLVGVRFGRGFFGARDALGFFGRGLAIAVRSFGDFLGARGAFGLCGRGEGAVRDFDAVQRQGRVRVLDGAAARDFGLFGARSVGVGGGTVGGGTVGGGTVGGGTVFARGIGGGGGRFGRGAGELRGFFDHTDLERADALRWKTNWGRMAPRAGAKWRRPRRARLRCQRQSVGNEMGAVNGKCVVWGARITVWARS